MYFRGYIKHGVSGDSEFHFCCLGSFGFFFRLELDCQSSVRSRQIYICNTSLRESSTDHEGCSNSGNCCSEDSMAAQVMLVASACIDATCFRTDWYCGICTPLARRFFLISTRIVPTDEQYRTSVPPEDVLNAVWRTI